MRPRTDRELLLELHQAVIGIPESPNDNGLLGKVDQLIAEDKIRNHRIQRVERHVNRIWGVLIALGAAGGAGFGLEKLLGG